MSVVAGSSVVMIEDDPVLGQSLMQRLRLAGVTTHWARTAAEGEALLRRHRPTMVLCDIRLPDGSGEALIARLMPELGGVPIVAMTAYGGIEQAVHLMRLGVDDYLAKPFPVQRLLDKLAAFAAGGPTPDAGSEGDEAGWRSPPMRALRAALERLAPAEATVLLAGESGAGKGLAARRLHAMAPARAPEPFVVVDCAALPDTIAEAEAVLLGRDGSAPEGGPGLAERAGAGTLFFDEISELAPPLQGRLLRLVEEHRLLRVGGREEHPLRARIVAATSADLRGRVAAGAFREDLWFRLSVVELVVPPLRERPEDLEDLARHFLHRFASAPPGGEPCVFANDGVAALHAHSWPGNARELRNRVQRAALLAASPCIAAGDLFPELAMTAGRGAAASSSPDAGQDDVSPVATGTSTAETASLAEARETAEREHIRRVLARCGGRMGDAARALGVSRTTLWDRMRRLGMPAR
ncbi:sigma-54-dependent transcriptional regulator [Falsiroseomonas sp.]|uniref:sigma-54-dependent transcriptional regulator n=1 Tax=Falsiroseomonas sp. TaxID=2870721 RepID=UPI0035663DDF